MSETRTPAFPALTILLAVFITLKLTGYVGWSWVWVLAPLWMGIGLAVVILALAALVMAVSK